MIMNFYLFYIDSRYSVYVAIIARVRASIVMPHNGGHVLNIACRRPRLGTACALVICATETEN